jgi:hypothetical protein
MRTKRNTRGEHNSFFPVSLPFRYIQNDSILLARENLYMADASWTIFIILLDK